jgi:hypothetical protein
MTTAIEKLDGLRAHVDDRGIDLALVERAETWLNALRQITGSSWREPAYVFYDNAEAEIQFTWYGKRDLGIAIKLQSVEYIQMWGPDINNHMMSGTISTTQEQMALWRWLREEQ